MYEEDDLGCVNGNPNVGKTTVFNPLTGARQHVGNWQGVTEERLFHQLEMMGHMGYLSRDAICTPEKRCPHVPAVAGVQRKRRICPFVLPSLGKGGVSSGPEWVEETP